MAKLNAMIGLHDLKDLSRADFLTSVGLYVLSDRLIMVRLRKSFLKVAVLEQQTRPLLQADNRQAISELTGWVAEDVREIALKAESDSYERVLRQAIVSLLPHLNAARDAVYLCVPQEQAITQQVFLPLAAEDNLHQVLEYEIERQLPFKRDDIYYDYLPIGRKGEKFGVYVFAIPKKSVDGLLEILESFGIKPRGIETTVTALANYLLFSDALAAGGAAMVAGHAKDWEMIGVRLKGSSWKPITELLYCHRFPAAEWAQGAGNELLQEGLSQVPRYYRCGDLTPLNGLAAGKLAAAEDMTRLATQRLEGFPQRPEAEVLPAVGTALRGVREAALGANFLRHEGSEGESSGTLSLLNTVLLGVLVLALVAWGASFPIKDELRLRQLQKENQKLEPAIDGLRREETQLERLRKEATLLTDLDQRRGEVLRVLDELSKVVPSSAYISNLRYRAGLLEVQGNAENASTLIPLLERSALFENVAFNAPSNRGRDNRETFSLKADLEKAKPNPPETMKESKGPPVKGSKPRP
ncbi:MAG TPA: PilN domain-containing protein [Candidatus Binatia bacterium]